MLLTMRGLEVKKSSYCLFKVVTAPLAAAIVKLQAVLGVCAEWAG